MSEKDEYTYPGKNPFLPGLLPPLPNTPRISFSAHVSDLLGPLKRAAIDATIPKGLFVTHTSDRYVITHPATGPNSRTIIETITRPNSSGEGGGEWSCSDLAYSSNSASMTAEYQKGFENVRKTIDDLFEPFLELPIPGECDDHIESMRQACRKLSFSPTGGNGTAPSGAGEIGPNLTAMKENLDEMSGTTIAQFKTKFLTKLEPTIASLHSAIAACASTLEAEKETFTKAREAVIEVISQSRNAFIASADNTAAEIKIALKFAELAVSAAKTFTGGGGLGMATDLVSLGIDITAAATNPEFTTDTNGTYDSVLNGMKSALDSIEDEIRNSEKHIAGYLEKCAGQMIADKTSYDLTVPPITHADTEDQNKVLITNDGLIREIWGEYLPTIGTEVSGADNHLRGIKLSFTRHSSFSYAPTGPTSQFSDYLGLIRGALDDLHTDIQHGALELKLAAADLQSTDEEIERLLDEIAKRVLDKEAPREG